MINFATSGIDYNFVPDLVPNIVPDLVPDFAPDPVPDIVPDIVSDIVPDIVSDFYYNFVLHTWHKIVTHLSILSLISLLHWFHSAPDEPTNNNRWVGALWSVGT